MYARTLYLVRYSLVTIACMMAIGFVTRYAGTDATLGLALANTGHAYPFFGTMIGWLGVALTGSAPLRTCCSAACSALLRNSLASTQFLWRRQTAPEA